MTDSRIHIDEVQRRCDESQLIADRRRLAKKREREDLAKDVAGVLCIFAFVLIAIIFLFPR